jgi:alpha-mannosidase
MKIARLLSKSNARKHTEKWTAAEIAGLARKSVTYVGRAALAAALALTASAQTMQAPDITKTETLYVVPYAHLDTQWRWEFPQSISEYLLKTMRVNFDLIDKYPHYVFNWTGANRYRLMKEYFPSDYARMKQYVAKGRWFPAGSSMEEGDVNLPNAEGIIRQVLYGNTYFRKEFGKASEEYMLPDCFGFPASLPSILAHAGVKGFSTQKLSSAWQPAPRVGGENSPEQTPEGIPFNVGIWKGTDGKSVIAALNPGGYGSTVNTDLSKEPPPPPPPDPNANGGRGGRGRGPQEQDWVKRINIDGNLTGVFADYHYVGTGDIGGAVNEQSVNLLEATVTKGMASLPTFGGRGGRGQNNTPPPPPNPPVAMGEGPVHVIVAAADQMFKDIKPEMTARMPQYTGDLELINHSAGSLTSEAYHKRWNRKNELLADAAEKASVAAQWMGGRPYPQERLNNAWTLVMGGHFHDTAAGTATPRSYEFAWNDDVIAMNQFATVLTSATEAVAAALNTQTRGNAIVVYNPLNIAREDVVEASVALPAGTKSVRVVGPDGKEAPAQFENGKVIFVAKTPSVGYAVFDVEAAASAPASTLKVSNTSLENARYRVTLNGDGDVASIFDKQLNKELLTSPVRLAISHDAPKQWPAWNMDWDQVHTAPRAYVSGPAQIRISENGPARVAVEVTREFEGSKFVSTVRLSAGDPGNRVEFANAIDWKGLASNVKATFAMTASNTDATYNWDIGTIQRPNEDERQFEVASHQWIDLTDKSGSYGATILTDVKNASDKFDDHTIRLTLLRTPGGTSYSDQFNQDWGHHEILFGIAGHSGDWRSAQTDWQGQRLNDPLVAFETAKHAGALGKEFSLLKIDNPRIRVMALKKAEMSDEVVLRMVELDGRPANNVHVHFAGPVASAREVNGQELPVGSATVQGGALVTSFTAYQPRTFALKLGAAPAKVAPIASKPVTLPYDLAAASNDDTKTIGGFDSKGDAIPAEMLPAKLEYDGVEFQLAPAGTGKQDAVIAKGQTINLPAGRYNRVYLLAASDNGDQTAAFRAGDKSVNLDVENWGGFIGQWDTRLWKARPESVTNGGRGGNAPVTTPLRQDWAVSANHATWDINNRGSQNWSPNYPQDFLGMSPGYIKRADVGWFASHHHTPDGLNEPYQYSYLFAYAIDLPANAHTLTLPDNANIRVLAVSVAEENPEVKPAQPLYDVLGSK